MKCHVLTIVLYLCWSRMRAFGTPSTYATFQSPITDDVLRQVVVDGDRGHVYVTGTNYVYKLNTDLTLIANASTGPEVAGGSSCSAGETNSDSICTPATTANDLATVLQINQADDYLLYCGVLNHGLCRVHRLDQPDENFNLQQLNASKVTNLLGSRRNVFAFFAEHTITIPREVPPTTVLYAAISHDGRDSDLESETYSARRWDASSQQLEYVYQSVRQISHRSAIDINTNAKETFVPIHVYGFVHDGFVYFVTVQPEALGSQRYHTRLARVCQRDSLFHSYTEITLQCTYQNGDSYNIATGGAKTTISHIRGADGSFPYTVHEDVLFVTFGRTEHNGFEANENAGSAVCQFSLSAIKTEFTRVQTECYQGRNQKLPYIGQGTSCRYDQRIFINMDDNFCGTDINIGIGVDGVRQGDLAITASQQLLTSINVMTHLEKNIAFIGTKAGLLWKVILDDSPIELNSNTVETKTHSAVILSSKEGSRIAPDTEFTTERDTLYVMHSGKLSVIPTRTCSVYQECASCIMMVDDLGCGWCGGDHCATEGSCQSHGWTRNGCDPVIDSYFPHSGPIEGGTTLLISGSSLGGTGASSVSVSVGEVDCYVNQRNMSFIECTTQSTDTAQTTWVSVSVVDRTNQEVPYTINGQSQHTHPYHYQGIIFSDFSPKSGPLAGGTEITLYGQHLNSGSNRLVTVVQPDLNCHVIENRSTYSQIVCITQQWQSGFDARYFKRSKRSNNLYGAVTLQIDNKEVISDDVFTYKPNPIITDMHPLTSIQSGGCNITVRGIGLDVIQRPVIQTAMDQQTSHRVCTVLSAEEMICRSPNITEWMDPEEDLSETIVDQDLVIIMDGLVETFVLSYHVDPEFEDFVENGTLLLRASQPFTVYGSYLNRTLLAKGYNITMGAIRCKVIDLYEDYLQCQPEVGPDGYVKEEELTVMISAGDMPVTILGSIMFVPEPRTDETTGAPKSSAVVPAVIAVFAVVVLVILGIFAYLKCTKRRPFHKKPGHGMSVRYDSGRSDQSENSYSSLRNRRHLQATASQDGAALSEESRKLIEDEHMYIDRDSLMLLEKIGQGHFGCVFHGLLKVENEKVEMEVAVKTLKAFNDGDNLGASTMECEQFLKEALLMRDFRHENVLRLIGVTLDSKDSNMPMVVLPFMKHGDLLSYIRDESNNPTVKQLMDFSVQIAEGMAYLSNLKFIHRDLAARNCMVADNMIIKVADFGLSRDIYERDYYSSDDQKAKLPVKWMALECLEKNIYNIKTDVWSYGVVVWELMTRGVCPYPEVDGWDMINFLKSGRRMPQPSYCPDKLYELMKQCWSEDGHCRPLFGEIAKKIYRIIDEMENESNQLVGTNTSYINLPPIQPIKPVNHNNNKATPRVPEPLDYPRYNHLGPADPRSPTLPGYTPLAGHGPSSQPPSRQQSRPGLFAQASSRDDQNTSGPSYYPGGPLTPSTIIASPGIQETEPQGYLYPSIPRKPTQQQI